MTIVPDEEISLTACPQIPPQEEEPEFEQSLMVIVPEAVLA